MWAAENTAEADLRVPQLAVDADGAVQIEQVEAFPMGIDLGFHGLGRERGLALDVEDRLLRVEQGTLECHVAVLEVETAHGAFDGNAVVAGDV